MSSISSISLPLFLLEWGLSLNLSLVFSELSWKPVNPINASISATLRGGVTST